MQTITKIFLNGLFIFSILFLLISGWFWIRSFIYPSAWGWSAPARWETSIRFISALFLSVSALYLVSVDKTNLLNPILPKGALAFILVLIVIAINYWVSLGSGVVAPIEDILREKGIDETKYSKLTTCEQIDAFAQVGYRYLDLEHKQVLVPTWMHESLKKQPTNSLVECFSNIGEKELEAIVGDSSEREVAVRSLYALGYEINSLKLQTSPKIQNILHIAVCEKGADPINDLIVIYYEGKFEKNVPYPTPPGFWDDARANLCNLK